MVKGVLFSPSLNLSLFSHSHDLIPGDQNQRRAGSINPVDHACVAVDYPPVNPSHFTFPMITPGCQAGPRACRSYSLNTGCGQKRGYLHSAKISSAPLVTRTGAASASSFFNLTSQSNIHSSRSSLRGVATCVISIPSTIANSISLSSIGEQQRPNTVCFPKRRQFAIWRRPSRSASTVFPSFRSNGLSPSFFLYFVSSPSSFLILDSQIKPHVSLQVTMRGFQVLKLHGQIGSTTGTECYHPRAFWRQRAP